MFVIAWSFGMRALDGGLRQIVFIRAKLFRRLWDRERYLVSP